jgi:ABC-type uncharacterized transport system auxiliary subunit
MNSNIMKKVILFTSLALLLLTACRKTNNPTVFSLGVDMQDSFKQDNVQVLIDNQPLLDSKVTTNNALSLGGSIATANTEGSHTIKVIVNDSIVTTETFTQKSDLYIGVKFNRAAKTVSLVYSAAPFTYH